MPAATARPSNEDRIRAALWFAARGFGIFPVWSTDPDGTCRCPAAGGCSSPGKHPITNDGFKSATTDAKRITTFLSAPSEPNYGLVPPEGVFVLDVDGSGWQERLGTLEGQHGPLPATIRSDTANGQHIFLRWPDGYPRPLKQLFGWVTRWGSGSHAGYVVGPRSVHATGAVYAPAADTALEIAVLPDAWAAAGVKPEHHTTVTVSTGLRDPSEVTVGNRHEWLRDTARLYAGAVRDPDALFAAVWAENEKLPAPKTEEEVRRAIGDVLTKFPADPVEQDPDTGEIRRVPSDEAGVPPPATGVDFPAPPAASAYSGLLGECVEQMAVGTDASLPGLLASFLAVCGAMVPARAYSRGEQTTSPYIALVGESSIGRKGTAMNRALDAARWVWQADKVNRVILDGLNSGEALISAMYFRKHDEEREHDEPVVAMVFEEEYASMIQSRSRDGSTLDPKMRTAFDGGPLSNRKANDSRVVQPPYWLPALAAITPSELRRLMKAGESQTGAANRWLYVPVIKRDILAPDIPPTFDTDTAKRLRKARGNGRARQVQVEDAVSRRLSEYGDFVIGHSYGVALDLVKRYTTLAFRVALIHAAVEGDKAVTLEHLERALALTEYARRGIAWVFGQTVGNRDADILLRYLQNEERMSNRFISRHIIRDPIRRMDAIDELLRLGYAYTEEVPTRGRPRLELVARPDRGAFVTYDLCHRVYTPTLSHTESVTEAPIHAQNGVSEGVTEGGQKPDKSLPEGGQKVVRPATGEWADMGCRDYRSHQPSHRKTPEGWVCDACHPAQEGQA